MKNCIQAEGDVMSFTAPGGGVVSGNLYLIGGLPVVAVADVAAGLPFQGRARGVFTLPKTDAQAWIEGQKIYWDNGNHRCDNDSTKGPLIGVASSAVAVTAGLVTGGVRLNGNAGGLLTGLEAAIADLVITVPNTQGGATPTAAQVDTAITNTAAPIIAKINTLLAELRLLGAIAP